jgi:Ankyrin repeats (3 copies)
VDEYEDVLNRLEREAGPDAIGRTRNPIVIERAKMLQEAEVIRLLEKGANPNTLSMKKETLLQVCVQNRLENAVRRLLSMGVDPNEVHATHTPTPLFRAARSGITSLVTLLLENGAAVDAPSSAGETPLMTACEGGHLEVARALVEAGAGIDKASTSGWTPLLHAGMGGHAGLAKFLLERGANGDARDCDGYTATDLARRRFGGMVAQGFRNLGITDLYVLDDAFKEEAGGELPYDVFVSYQHERFAKDADELRDLLIRQRKRVFVDRFELRLDPASPTNDEIVKWKLANALRNTSLTIFFEMFWEANDRRPKDSDARLNWQYFELLNSRRAVLVSTERKFCEELVMIPGEPLRTGDEAAKYDSYAELVEWLMPLM